MYINKFIQTHLKYTDAKLILLQVCFYVCKCIHKKTLIVKQNKHKLK